METNLDGILRRKIDDAHLHHEEILPAKFGKNWTVTFLGSRVWTIILHTNERHGITL